MEGILIFAAGGYSIANGLVLFVLVLGLILLGYTEDEQVVRRRIFWAEWPLMGKKAGDEPGKARHPKAA